MHEQCHLVPTTPKLSHREKIKNYRQKKKYVCCVCNCHPRRNCERRTYTSSVRVRCRYGRLIDDESDLP